LQLSSFNPSRSTSSTRADHRSAFEPSWAPTARRAAKQGTQLAGETCENGDSLFAGRARAQQAPVAVRLIDPLPTVRSSPPDGLTSRRSRSKRGSSSRRSQAHDRALFAVAYAYGLVGEIVQFDRDGIDFDEVASEYDD
jgi:hypothetical protein